MSTSVMETGKVPVPGLPKSQGGATRSQQFKNGALVPQDGQRQVELPELRSSDQALDRTKPLPTSLQSDFLPSDILQAISNVPRPQDQLGPLTFTRNLNTSSIKSRKPPANVWSNPKRRERFKHLTENTNCLCGAGNDISFLYDVPKKEAKPEKPLVADSSHIRVEETERGERRTTLQLPDTLIPDEYHVIKNKGVLGLEYHEDQYTTQPEDHDKHLVTFPSMNPTSRYEVVRLKKAMEEMLEKIGINDTEIEVKGPTQMHNLLELIKKEQNIYNIIFHELIRQTSIQCVDRGELLAQLRNKYSELLNKVPRQIMGLHEEVMAQRALDRRLTEELMRFKSTIGVLTSELSEVKEHDREVTKQAQQAQDELKNALAESQKNAGLLAEYHDLYELQRQRLEAQVIMLAEEKEIWSTAAYSLALKVTEEHSLNTARRLHVSEKTWAKLAKHFTILLSDQDTEVLTQLQTFVELWRDLIEDFSFNLRIRDNEMTEKLKMIKGGIHYWMRDFEKSVLGKEGNFQKAPDKDKTMALYNDIKKWEENLGSEGEKFGGDTLLSSQEILLKIRRQMDGWTDCALRVFGRHRSESGANYPDHDTMMKLNEEVEELLNQFHVRLTGENGVARGIINLNNALETWDNKLTAVLHGSNPLPDQEWLRLYQLMEDWVISLEETFTYIGSTQKEEDQEEGKPHRKMEVQSVVRVVQRWLASATNGIDSEDAKLVEQVSTLHTEMVKWMVQMLLRLAPDKKDHSKEATEASLVGIATIGQLQANAKSLFERLDTFSKYVVLCCSGIVSASMQKKLDAQEDNADHEYRDLQKLKGECDDWIHTAKLLLCELTGEPFPDSLPTSLTDVTKPEDPKAPTTEDSDKPQEETETKEEAPEGEAAAPEGEGGAPEGEGAAPAGGDKAEEIPITEPPSETQEGTADAAAEAEQEEEVKEEGETLEVIGFDESTHVKRLDQRPDEAPQEVRTTSKPVVARDRPDTPNTKAAYEALAAVQTLQTQLLSTEERAQLAEEKAASAEAELKAAQEKVRALERRLAATPGGESQASEAKPKSAASVGKPKSATGVKTEEKKEKEPAEEETKAADGEKEKDKQKRKEGSTSRSSSRASTKSKKK